MATRTPGVRLGGSVAVATLLAVVLADILAGRDAVLVSLAILGPLLASLTSSLRVTVQISALAMVFALLSFIWNHTFPHPLYWIPLAVVLSASACSFVIATLRLRLVLDAERLRLLADLAEVAEARRGADELARDVAALLVPRLVDFCVISQIDPDGREQRLAGAFNGSERLLEEFMAREPLPAGHCAAGSGRHPQSRLVGHIDEETRRRLATDPNHLRLLEQMALASSVNVPLFTRERHVGTLTLATVAPRTPLGASDVEYLETLAGRLALALDNASLNAELTRTKSQLDAIFGAVDAGITVRDREGRTVYANNAAARLLELPDAAAVLAAPLDALSGRFDTYTEEGEPLDLARLPGARLLAGEVSPEPLTIRNVSRETGAERWLLYKASPILDEGGSVSLAVNVVEDVTSTKRNEIAQRLLATTARELAESRDPVIAMQAVAEAAVPGLADWAGVDLLEGGLIRPVAIAHRDPAKVRLGWRLRIGWPADPAEETGIAAVVRTGQPHLIPEVTDEMLLLGASDEEHLGVLRAIGLNSTMTTPIRAGEEILGTLSFVSSTSRRFDEHDLQLALDLGRPVGLFLVNARLHAEQAHIAHTLQASLVPDSLPDLPGWSISSAYRAAGEANEVGGDFYDVVEFRGGWAAVIGDVTGKGASAAAITAMARHTVAAILKASGDVRQALEVLNLRLRESPADAHTLTTVAVLEVRGDQATVISAGHPLPLLRRGRVVRPVGQPGPLLGFLDHPVFHPTELRIEPGDQFVLYTDGALDAAGAHERFGEQRLQTAVTGLAAEPGTRAAEVIVEQIEGFLRGAQSDDIAILTLSRSAAVGRIRQSPPLAA